MEKNIRLQLSQPDKVVIAGNFPAVIVPAQLSNLTIIPGRAPSLILLTNGMLQLLDEKSAVVAKYFLQGGLATVANEECLVSSEKIIAKADISLAEASARLEQAADDNEKAFYQIIVDELTAFP